MKRAREGKQRIDMPCPTKESIEASTTQFVRKTTDKDFEPSMSKIISWNVNGLRAVKKSGHLENLFKCENPDVVCLQETKLSRGIPDLPTIGSFDGYTHYDCVSVKNGYSGTRVYVRSSINHSLLSYSLDTFEERSGIDHMDDEGRVVIIEFDSIVLINTYVPNAGDGLRRIDFRVNVWDKKMIQCLKNLQKHLEYTKKDKSIIWTGDLNVAVLDYDRYFFKSYEEMGKCAGFSPQERNSFKEILQSTGMVDTFRQLYPYSAPVYSFWSYRILGRKNGLGWRLDYFVVPKDFMQYVVDSFMLSSVLGSDHCPCALWLKRKL